MMTYYVEIHGDSISGLYNDDVMPPPIGAIEISDIDGTMLSRVSKFGNYKLDNGKVVLAKTDEQFLSVTEFEHALDAYLDSVARSHRWDNRFTFVARAAYPNAWREQAIAFGEWMDGCNIQAYQLLEDVTAGTKPAPKSIDDFISMFPKFSIG